MKLSEAIEHVKLVELQTFDSCVETDARTIRAIRILLGVAEYVLGSGDIDYGIAEPTRPAALAGATPEEGAKETKR